MFNTDGYQIENIIQLSTQKLCEIVVVARYLGSLQDEAVSCMQELARRRELGDQFNYELVIENEYKKLPDFKINLKKKMQVGYDLTVLKGIR